MFTGILFVISLFAIMIVVFWSIQNEGLNMWEKTRGLLAMKDDEKDSESEKSAEVSTEGLDRTNIRTSKHI